MSALAYGALTKARIEGAPGTTDSTSPPGVKPYLDALAALVPAEVLALHALIIGRTTETTTPAGGQPTITITEPTTLRGVFWALLVLTIVVYALGRRKNWDRWDAVRMFIPAAAFVGWTMLQKGTAFDAVAPNVGQVPREVIALIGAAALGALANALAYKADQNQ